MEKIVKTRPAIAEMIISLPDFKRSGLLAEVETVKAPKRIKIRAKPPAMPIRRLRRLPIRLLLSE